MSQALSVLELPLQPCSYEPMTGYLRDGCCQADPLDRGQHLVCVVLTAEFLEFSRSRGNDLLTPRPEWGFPGLAPGDRWCLCLERWIEALHHGKAPAVVLAATHENVLERLSLETLVQYALDRPLSC